MSTPPVAASGRDTTRTVPWGLGFRAIFELALNGMIWTRRSLLMGALLGLPVLFAVLYRAVLVAKLPPQMTGFDLYGVIVALYVLSNALPLAALFYAVSLIADEVEGKTITYLLTRPVPRPAVLLGKFAAFLATTLGLLLPATVVTFFLLVTAPGTAGLAAAVPHLFRDLGAMAMGVLAYGAFFTLMGVLLRRPVIPGLLFLYVWELLAHLPGYLPRLTISAYLRSLVSHRPPAEGLAEVFGQALPVGLSILSLTAMAIVFLAAAVWIFSRREYVLEQ
jgi:ABC-type transport system involved in multi-copper enzyme maturation permease subunit